MPVDIKRGDSLFPLYLHNLVIAPNAHGKPLPDESVSELRASHVLEHFPQAQIPEVLREWVRCLKPGGMLKIAVPDFNWIIAAYRDGNPKKLPLASYLMGGQTDEHDFHKAIFCHGSLSALMRDAGLTDIQDWKSEIEDCASLPVSLNLMGRKPITLADTIIPQPKHCLHGQVVKSGILGISPGSHEYTICGCCNGIYKRGTSDIGYSDSNRCSNCCEVPAVEEERVVITDGTGKTWEGVRRGNVISSVDNLTAEGKATLEGMRRVEEFNDQFRKPNPKGRYPLCRPAVGNSTICIRCGGQVSLDRPCPVIPFGERWGEDYVPPPPETPTLIDGKPADQLTAAAVMSLPRLGWNDHWACALSAFGQLNMELDTASGVYWDQALTRMIERRVEKGTDFIYTCDFDAVFTKDDVARLGMLLIEHPEVDVIVPMMMKREGQELLAHSDGEVDMNQPLVEILIGHFGLSIFRRRVFEKLTRPWFIGMPDEDGRWGENRRDPDVQFWHNCRAAGIKVMLATQVKVGHLELRVAWPSKTLQPVWQSVTHWQNNGRKPPEEATDGRLSA